MDVQGPFNTSLTKIERQSTNRTNTNIQCTERLWMLVKNKIRHSSRSSSIHRSKITADQRCLIITIFGKFSFPISIEKKDGQKTNRQTVKKKKKTIRKKEDKHTFKKQTDELMAES